MRTVSFSDARVRKALNNDFVCCVTNTKGDPTAGASFNHSPNDAPGPCGRGAGRQNVQTMFLNKKGEIFHVATGFLSAEDLLSEMDFAKQLFRELQRQPNQGRDVVVKTHVDRLRRKGFSNQQISSADNMLANMMMSGPNPQDFGMKLPGGSNSFFGDINRQRDLRDNKFSIRYPLLTKSEFERDPTPLVGKHKSFFGSNSAMNFATQRINQRAGGPQRNAQFAADMRRGLGRDSARQANSSRQFDRDQQRNSQRDFQQNSQRNRAAHSSRNGRSAFQRAFGPNGMNLNNFMPQRLR